MGPSRSAVLSCGGPAGLPAPCAATGCARHWRNRPASASGCGAHIPAMWRRDISQPIIRCLPGRAAASSAGPRRASRSEEHTSELQSLMRISYAVFCLKKKKPTPNVEQIHIVGQKKRRGIAENHVNNAELVNLLPLDNQKQLPYQLHLE